MTGCIDKSFVVDLTKSGDYVGVDQKNYALKILDMRPDSAKVFRKFPKGMAYYLGDDQTRPSRIAPLNECLVSGNMDQRISQFNLKRFDILVILDESMPGDWGEFSDQMGNAMVKGAILGSNGGAASSVVGAQPPTFIPCLPQNFSSEKITYSTVIVIQAEVNGKLIEIVKKNKYNLFAIDDDEDVRQVTTKTLHEIMKELRDKISTEALNRG